MQSEVVFIGKLPMEYGIFWVFEINIRRNSYAKFMKWKSITAVSFQLALIKDLITAN
jgi:hypothetical protein